jgi:putative methyltransferase (TIGR04325 family)
MYLIKSYLKKILPDYIKNSVTGFFYGWSGDYSSWDNAKKKCIGYSSPEIIAKVRESALKVRNGEFPYERDSVLFNKIQYSYPLLASLLWIAEKNNGRLNVLDFGGALGSSYYQNIKFLNSISEVKWCIVEQSQFVHIGQSEFQNGILKFFSSVDDCIASYNIDICILSSVLQYIESPYKLLDSIISKQVKFILIDRTPFIKGKDRITIQKAHPKIYSAKYPCWFFNLQNFKRFMSEKYNLVLEFDAFDKANIQSEFKGFLYELK